MGSIPNKSVSVPFFDCLFQNSSKFASRREWNDVIRKDLREMGTSWRVQIGRLGIDWDGGEACGAMLASDGLLQQ